MMKRVRMPRRLMGKQRKMINMRCSLPLFGLWWVLRGQYPDILVMVQLDGINFRLWSLTDEASVLLLDICHQFCSSISLLVYQSMSNCNANLVGCMFLFSPSSHSYGVVL